MPEVDETSLSECGEGPSQTIDPEKAAWTQPNIIFPTLSESLKMTLEWIL